MLLLAAMSSRCVVCCELCDILSGEKDGTCIGSDWMVILIVQSHLSLHNEQLQAGGQVSRS